MMERIHTVGIWMAESLQRETGSLEGLWLFATHAGNPKAAFLLLFPLADFFSRRAGVAVLWVGALADWLNLTLKWVMFGERPYWWIGESRVFLAEQPQVQQFSATCENGAGSPSGHAMATAAVGWVVASSLASFLSRRTRSWPLTRAPYLLYAAFLLAVCLSRVFLLAHFPHQVLSGALVGLLVGSLLNRRVPEGRRLFFFVSLSAALMGGALMLYAGLQQMGVDLSWSLSLAHKWCQRADWVRPDMSSFTSLTRDCGTLLGLGLAEYWKPGGWSLPRTWRALSLALSSAGLYLVHRLPTPVRPPALFYSLVFVKFALVPQIVMALVPGLVHLVTLVPGLVHLVMRRKRD
ncbi:glucose-6-phosphatase 3-like isoform X1 [Entelurus aequoreus]|uniref:glucose-6-phosphatase 3-like isoform X1 n=1 Tax=Entelurus aequoreus TaxID=161455 RepID=UPI002B1D18E1|nr:glucose-6-phosphatase 3-like isoform X1 [Entelurus aequoreus]